MNFGKAIFQLRAFAHDRLGFIGVVPKIRVFGLGV
jgi:hypothetical protein